MASPSIEQTSNRPADGLASQVPKPVRMMSFWAAVSLPVVNFGLLMYGIDSPLTSALFLTLLSLNLAALVFGHTYEP
jgi:hypothetical protein